MQPLYGRKSEPKLIGNMQGTKVLQSTVLRKLVVMIHLTGSNTATRKKFDKLKTCSQAMIAVEHFV